MHLCPCEDSCCITAMFFELKPLPVMIDKAQLTVQKGVQMATYAVFLFEKG